MGFDATRVAEAAVPDLLIAGGVAAANLLTRALDAKAGRTKTLSQWNTYTHVGIMSVGAYFVGTGRNETMGKTMMIADFVPLTDRFAAPIIEEAVGVRVSRRGLGRREIQGRPLLTEGRRIRQSVVPEFEDVRVH